MVPRKQIVHRSKKIKLHNFRPRQKKETLDLPFKINDNLIARAKGTVFLGVILDENLSWKPHILNVSRKISKFIGIIYKASFCPPSSALVTTYYSLMYPHLMYCVLVFGVGIHLSVKLETYFLTAGKTSQNNK